MKKIVFKPRIRIDGELNLKNLSFLNLEKPLLRKIQRIKLLYKNQEINLEKLFEIKITKTNYNNNEVVISGLNKFCNYLGYEWKGGVLRINSNVGSFIGARMLQGEIIVNGSTENYLGSEMQGGHILIKSNTLDFAGSPMPGSKVGMNGGVIVILGNARDYLGLNMKRGKIYVKGNSRDYCCNNMVAGTVIIKRKYGKNIGNGMKRGTIILYRNVLLNKNFVRSGGLSLTYINLINDFFLKNYGERVFERNARFKRFCGDRSNEGIGELIVKEIY